MRSTDNPDARFSKASTGRRWLQGAALVALLASSLYLIPGATPARAAVGDITTAIGGPGEGQATNLGQVPSGVALRRTQSKLTVYVADTYHHVVRAIDTETGLQTVVAGGGPAFGDDGPARSAQLNTPRGVAVDATGNIYIADTNNHRVRKVDTAGKITTVAGNGTAGYGGDCDAAVTSCPATLAQLSSPSGLTLDGAGNVFIADTSNHRIRKVDTSGKITTMAGNGTAGPAGDAALARLAQLSSPRGVAADGAGNLFIADTGNNRVRKVDASGLISTTAGGSALDEDGTAARSKLASPHGVWASAGQVLIADTGNHRVRRVDAAGTISTVAGDGTAGFTGDNGAAAAGQLNGPQGIAQEGATVVLADTGNYRTRRMESGLIATVAGNGTESFGGDGGPAVSAQISKPGGMAFDPDGTLIFVDAGNQRVRKVDSSGIISTVAGNGSGGFSGDGGAATAAQLNFHGPGVGVGDVAVDDDKTLFIADPGNHRVRKVDPAGVITTVAGTGTEGFSGDGGQATAAKLNYVSGLHLTPTGELLIADLRNSRVRRIDTLGVIRTFAGGGLAWHDGEPATGADLTFPYDVYGDATGNVYIATDRRIRKVNSNGTITTVAGRADTYGDFGDGGPAASAALGASGVTVDAGGNTFVATLNRVRRVDTAGTISAFAGQEGGDAVAGFSGDGGPAASARLHWPRRVALDASGTLFIADNHNDRIRTVAGAGVTRPSADRVAPLLEVDRIQPSAGTESGGTHVAITGSGFTETNGVTFGDKPASSFLVESDTIIHAASPPGAGTVEVSVRSAQGSSLRKMPFSYFEPSGSWSPSGSLSSGSLGHTATVLSGPACDRSVPSVCGRVLLAGSRAELYDPSTNTWAFCTSETASPQCPGPLGAARAGHKTTLLRDGRVLVVGGVACGSWPECLIPDKPQAELYDPSTGKWSPTGRMVNGRNDGHTATLLPDGQVLVTGPDASAELYDPQEDRWVPVSSMGASRSGHTATVLKNGQVIVVGGQFSPHSAELYDPASRSWRPTANMAVGRSSHTATALAAGKVLVVGGDAGAASAEVYDPAADNGVGKWAPTSGIPFARRVGHTATLLASGKVLVAGGCCDPADLNNVRPFDSAELYDPGTGRFARTASLADARTGAAAVLLATDKVLVTGGKGVFQHQKERLEQVRVARSSELFQETQTSSAPVVAKIHPAGGPTSGGRRVILRGGGLFPTEAVQFGGRRGNVVFASDSYVVALTPPLSQGVVDATVTTPIGRSPASPETHFSYGAGAWSGGENLASCASQSDDSCVPRQHHTATLLENGRVLLAGGTRNMQLGFIHRTVQLYDPVTGNWSPTAPMHEARFQHSATLLKDGRVLVVGGQDAFMNAVKTAEVYDPDTGQWSFTEPMMNLNSGRFSHSATLLQNGMVLVAGGSHKEGGRPALASAELFDPVTNRWVGTEPLRSPRQYHTATPLPDGRVVVHGGLGGDCTNRASTDCLTASTAAAETLGTSILASTEIFDPRANGGSGTWRASASSSVARFHHSANLLSGSRCLDLCGKILAAGGNNAVGALSSGELFDPVTETWAPTAPLRTARGGHTATLLADGTVLVAGSGPPFHGSESGPYAVAAAEVYDPSTNSWTNTDWMRHVRGVHSATLLDTAPCGTNCGKVLVAGGAGLNFFSNDPDAIEAVELYTPAPRIETIDPAITATTGGGPVTITGDHFRHISEVTFGGTPAASFTVDSPRRITAFAPAHPKGAVEVAVVNGGGTSATIVPDPSARFVYAGAPGPLVDLEARPVSDTTIELSFSSPDDGTTLAPAKSYIVKQSEGQINEGNFDTALSLCTPRCDVPLGKRVVLAVNDLEPEKTYYYAVRAIGPLGELGPQSRTVSATTLRSSPTVASGSCTSGVSSSADALRYSAGKYHLVGLPHGTLLAPESGLYSWFNLAAGGSYTRLNGTQPAEGGRGYWAWFACPTSPALSGGSGDSVFSLDAYHASMVGNPSSVTSAHVSGHDFGARWNPDANDGVGGYELSGYRERMPLGIGEGAWVFSYVGTEVHIEAAK